MKEIQGIFRGLREIIKETWTYHNHYDTPKNLTPEELQEAIKEYQSIVIVASWMIATGIGAVLDVLPENIFRAELYLVTVVAPGVALLDKTYKGIKALTKEAQARGLLVKGRTFLTRKFDKGF